MAKDQKKSAPRTEKSAAAYYDLKTEAVNDLVNANVTNAPEVREKELRKYRHKSLLNLGDGIRFFLLKWWFAGVICWFFMIGLGSYGIDQLDMMLILGVVTGLIWDLPVNIFIRLKAEKKEYRRWMMFPDTGVSAGIWNVLYGMVLVLLTAATYTGVNRLIFRLGGDQGLMVGPILYGVFIAGWDWLLLKMRKTGASILADAKKNASAGNRPRS